MFFLLCSNYIFYIISEISFKFSWAIKVCSSSFFIFFPISCHPSLNPMKTYFKKTHWKKVCWKFRMYILLTSVCAIIWHFCTSIQIDFGVRQTGSWEFVTLSKLSWTKSQMFARGIGIWAEILDCESIFPLFCSTCFFFSLSVYTVCLSPPTHTPTKVERSLAQTFFHSVIVLLSEENTPPPDLKMWFLCSLHLQFRVTSALIIEKYLWKTWWKVLSSWIL